MIEISHLKLQLEHLIIQKINLDFILKPECQKNWLPFVLTIQQKIMLNIKEKLFGIKKDIKEIKKKMR